MSIHIILHKRTNMMSLYVIIVCDSIGYDIIFNMLFYVIIYDDSVI